MYSFGLRRGAAQRLRSVDRDNLRLTRKHLTLFFLLLFNYFQVKSGEFQVSASMSPLELLKKMASSQVRLYRLTIAEGLTVAQIAAASVRTTGEPTAPMAPYMLEWESEATKNEPGVT